MYHKKYLHLSLQFLYGMELWWYRYVYESISGSHWHARDPQTGLDLSIIFLKYLFSWWSVWAQFPQLFQFETQRKRTRNKISQNGLGRRKLCWRRATLFIKWWHAPTNGLWFLFNFVFCRHFYLAWCSTSTKSNCESLIMSHQLWLIRWWLDI